MKIISGALTKGDRRAATGADLTEFNFDTAYGRNALRTMYHHISHVRTDLISVTQTEGFLFYFEVFSDITLQNNFTTNTVYCKKLHTCILERFGTV